MEGIIVDGRMGMNSSPVQLNIVVHKRIIMCADYMCIPVI